MKVLFLTRTLSYGGAAKMIAFVANTLTKSNHDVTILLVSGVEVLQPVEKNIKIINKNIEAINGKYKHFKRIDKIKDIIKDENPDVIVSFLTFPNFYATIIGRILSIPVIISERGNPFCDKGLKDELMYYCLNFANGAVFQTNGAKEYFSKRLQKRSCVIPNPVVRKSNNNNIKFDISTDNHEIVYVARFDNVQKRQDLMVEAFEKVLATYPDAVLKFYGTGKDLGMIENLVITKKLENNVRFMGYSDKPEEEMVKSEVFVLTSDYEGIPNTLIEAMSVGMPVVSTDCDPGGARMLIENNVNGVLVPKNDAEGIANAIVKIFSDKDLRGRISKEAYKITEKYTVDKISRQWHDYIMKIIKKGK